MKNKGSIILILIIIFSLSAQLPTDFSAKMMIKVSIVGAVGNPGVYTLEAGSRLSEAIQLSEESNIEMNSLLAKQKLPEQESELEVKKEYSLRHIELRRKDEVINIDLEKYFTLGDLINNPQLKDEDLIYIPTATKNLSITGAVNAEGDFELASGDRISDLIALALGLNESARLDSASLVRLDYQTGDITEFTFSPAVIFADESSRENMLLQSGDRLYIRSMQDYESKFSVEVAGKAIHPGEYAIEPGKTALYEILKKAGGANRLGSLKYAYLQRISERDTTIIYDPEYKRLMDRSLLELSRMEIEYLKFKNRELSGKIVVDFTQQWQSEGSGEGIYLQDNDYIYIPESITTVEVSGAVLYPGAYKWESGKNYEYYIALAGGYTNRAKKSQTRLILAESGAWLKKDKEQAIEQGDKIFVPEKDEKELWEISKEALSIMAQLATVVLAVINIYTN